MMENQHKNPGKSGHKRQKGIAGSDSRFGGVALKEPATKRKLLYYRDAAPAVFIAFAFWFKGATFRCRGYSPSKKNFVLPSAG